jgi:hypothetical protein
MLSALGSNLNPSASPAGLHHPAIPIPTEIPLFLIPRYVLRVFDTQKVVG